MKRRYIMNLQSMTLAALILVLSPALAFAHPIQSTGTRVRPTMFHDRSPRLHDHTPVAHH